MIKEVSKDELKYVSKLYDLKWNYDLDITNLEIIYNNENIKFIGNYKNNKLVAFARIYYSNILSELHNKLIKENSDTYEILFVSELVSNYPNAGKEIMNYLKENKSLMTTIFLKAKDIDLIEYYIKLGFKFVGNNKNFILKYY